jgi:hypothetical protein
MHRLRNRRWSYAILLVLAASGALHFFLHQWFPAAGAFGPEPNPGEPWALRVHGAAAMATLWLLGVLWPTHILPWLARRCNRRAGVLLLAVSAALVVTGYGLYYASGDALRSSVRWLHVGFGFAVIPAFAVHLRRGRASVRHGHALRKAATHRLHAGPVRPARQAPLR